MSGKKEAAGTKILLSKNFRSCAGILDTVNFVFSNIMSVEFGEMDYTQDEWLVAGRDCGLEDAFDEYSLVQGSNYYSDAAVEVDIVDMCALEQEDEEESPAGVQVEAEALSLPMWTEPVVGLQIEAEALPLGVGLAVAEVFLPLPMRAKPAVP